VEKVPRAPVTQKSLAGLSDLLKGGKDQEE